MNIMSPYLCLSLFQPPLVPFSALPSIENQYEQQNHLKSEKKYMFSYKSKKKIKLPCRSKICNTMAINIRKNTPLVANPK